MRFLRVFIALVAAWMGLTLLAGCLDDLRYHMACQVPKTIEASRLIGTWRAEYDNYINPDADFVLGTERISGIEEVILQPDGTYTQRFQSPQYSYERSGNRWELINHPSEGQKLVMYDLVYFAQGLKLSQGPLELFPQRADFSRYQRLRFETGIEAEKLMVNYPADGFVYLYPRYCLGKLQLLQMTSSWGDPDALAPVNPMFSRVK
ncbi:MAG: hypothetical protein NZ528_13095 [Caldilineales bacterium]|nr:hypothetical protein [Caldilineales bacterium]